MMTVPDHLVAERRVKTRRFLTVLAVLLVLAGAAYGVYSMTLGRQVLQGETVMDFGVIEFDTYGATVSGQFELVNSLSEPLTIPKVSSSCGCTAVEPGPWTIGPGETWVLPVSFEITKTGYKDATLKVVLEGRGVQTLYVQGIGRDTRLLTSPQANGFALRPGLPSIVSIHAATYDEGAPPALEVTQAPDNVTITFEHWKQSPVQRKGKYEPVLWTTQLTVRQEEGEAIKDGAITLTAVGTDQSITIPVNSEIPSTIVEPPAANR